MRLYVVKRAGGEKIYLKKVAQTRQVLAKELGTTGFNADGHYFKVQEVMAEPSDSTAESMALGGVVGVLGGVPGVVLGGLIGGLIGKNAKEEDEKKAEIFNRS